MKKGLFLSLLLIGFATLLLSCNSSLTSADIDKTLDALEQTVQESENLSKEVSAGDFTALTKLPDIAIKFQEQLSKLQGAESTMTPEQKERMAELVKRFNLEDQEDENATEVEDNSEPKSETTGEAPEEEQQ